jgi:hypothetical protein
MKRWLEALKKRLRAGMEAKTKDLRSEAAQRKSDLLNEMYELIRQQVIEGCPQTEIGVIPISGLGFSKEDVVSTLLPLADEYGYVISEELGGDTWRVILTKSQGE